MNLTMYLARRSRARLFGETALLASMLIAGACGGTEPAPPATTSAPAAAPASAATPASSGPRVFFVEPQDGATVKSPVHLKFGAENFMIMPVPEGTVDMARSGMGHHHVAIDSDCLPPGTVIVKAAPWVHFGKGDAEMDMQLPPGPHKLTLQIGDDKHTTIAGLCSTINVNVAP